jgi:molybdenum cofactor cytidylyltransferase
MSASRETTPRVFAIVPAAGLSRRMGVDKLLITRDGRTLIEEFLHQLSASRVGAVVLVTRSRLVGKVDLESFKKVSMVFNDDDATEMIDSIRLGLDAIERHHAHERDGLLICPADHPGLTTDDFDRCISAFENAPDRIVVAAHAGKRGHPTIIPGSLVDVVRSDTCDSGLRALATTRPDLVLTVACQSTAVVRDVDTPEDLERLGDGFDS